MFSMYLIGSPTSVLTPSTLTFCRSACSSLRTTCFQRCTIMKAYVPPWLGGTGCQALISWRTSTGRRWTGKCTTPTRWYFSQGRLTSFAFSQCEHKIIRRIHLTWSGDVWMFITGQWSRPQCMLSSRGLEGYSRFHRTSVGSFTARSSRWCGGRGGSMWTPDCGTLETSCPREWAGCWGERGYCAQSRRANGWDGQAECTPLTCDDRRHDSVTKAKLNCIDRPVVAGFSIWGQTVAGDDGPYLTTELDTEVSNCPRFCRAPSAPLVPIIMKITRTTLLYDNRWHAL